MQGFFPGMILILFKEIEYYALVQAKLWITTYFLDPVATFIFVEDVMYENDMLNFLRTLNLKAELIVCMGDSLTHLESVAQVDELLGKAAIPLFKSTAVTR